MTTVPSVEIRTRTGTDVEAALEVWRAARAADGARPPAARARRVREKLSDPQALLVVAADGPEVVGMALGEPGRAADGSAAPDVLHLSMLYVHPGARRQGVGGALAEGLADAAYPRGARRLQAWTRTSDAPARAFYAACGLEPTGAEQVLEDGSPAVQYAAELDPPMRELVVREGGLRLGQLLKLAGLVETGSEGKALLEAGEVQVNGEVELRRGRQLADGDVVVAHDEAVQVVLPAP